MTVNQVASVSGGSTPSPPTISTNSNNIIKYNVYRLATIARVAQLVEHQSENLRVIGSNPILTIVLRYASVAQ